MHSKWKIQSKEKKRRTPIICWLKETHTHSFYLLCCFQTHKKAHLWNAKTINQWIDWRNAAAEGIRGIGQSAASLSSCRLPVASAITDREENRATRLPAAVVAAAATLSVNFTQRLASSSLKRSRAPKWTSGFAHRGTSATAGSFTGGGERKTMVLQSSRWRRRT